MKSIFIAIFFYLVNTSVSALTPYEATYTLSWFGIKAGVDNRKLTVKNNLYHYQSNAKTTGLGKLIKDYNIEAETILGIDHSGVNADSYSVLEVINGAIEKNIAIKLKNDDLDPLSLFLVLSYEIQNNPTKTNFNFKVNDGKKIERHHYQIVKDNDDNLVKIIEKDKNIELHFARNQDALLIFFKNPKISLKLKSVIFSK